eukprot:COSAG01_NODE_9485_length_2434_cov_22.689079_2_plen_622_part_00
MDAMELSLDGLSLDLDQVSSPLSPLATGTCAHDVAAQRQAGAAMAACFRSLTNDCLVSIFRYLRPWPDLASASQVCRRFAQLLARHRSLWAHLEVTGGGSHRHHGALLPVNDRVIVALARRAGPALRRITVRGCAALSVGGVAETLTQGGAAAVSAVELADCPGLGVAAVVSRLAAACGGLRSLSMSGFRARPSAGESEETCDGVPTAEVAQPLCQLTHCRLEDCYLSGVEELAATLRQLGPQLQHLEIVVAGVAAREDRSVAAHLVDVVAASPAVEQLRVLQLGELTSRSAQWTDSLSLSMMEDSMDSGRGSITHPSGNSGGIGMLLMHDGVASTPDSCVEALFRRCSSGSLETLELAGFRGLVGSALEHAPRSLQELSMRGCSGLTSLPLPSCKSLTTISLEGCSALADAAIISVGRQCPTLTELNVEGCEQLSDSAMEAAVAAGGFRHLKRLNLRGCQQLTSTTLASVAHASCGQLVHVAAGLDRMSVLSLNMPSVESSYAGVEDDAWRWLAPVDNEGVVMLATTCSLAFLGAPLYAGGIAKQHSQCPVQTYRDVASPVPPYSMELETGSVPLPVVWWSSESLVALVSVRSIRWLPTRCHLSRLSRWLLARSACHFLI